MDVGLDHKIYIYTLPKGPKHKKRGMVRDKMALEAHGIATNV